MATDTPQIQYRSPFDDADADMIIRSSDDVYFRVHRMFLKKASPVFADMFLLPALDDAVQPETVPVAEDGKTLEALLRLCYPTGDPRVTNIDEITKLFTVCEKYQMESAMVRLLRTNMGNFLTTWTDPLRIYALACRVHAEQEARQAAYHCLALTARDIIECDAPELRQISIEAYRGLLKYHSACSLTSRNVLMDSDPERHIDYCWGLCCYKGDHVRCESLVFGNPYDDGFKVPRWWYQSIEQLETRLLHEIPPLRLQLYQNARLPKNIPCVFCGPRFKDDMYDFLHNVERESESRIKSVSHMLNSRRSRTNRGSPT